MEIITPEINNFFTMCAVCVSDRGGAQIAILVIVGSLSALGLANWAWNKYLKKNNQEFTIKK
tara:strand:+ start:270 stop:455 length:186 start_codon:yes stop_codon:yes gene_type:complete